jgi:hypothetical protein
LEALMIDSTAVRAPQHAAGAQKKQVIKRSAVCAADRTKVGNLLKPGVGLRSAIITGVSSKSYWHMARTPATQ